MLWNPGARPKPSRLCPVSDKVIPTRCERVVMVRLEAPLRAANVLVGPRPKTSREGLYTARTLVRARPRVPVTIMILTNQDQVIGEGTTIRHGEPVTWAALVDVQ
jgi:hypothetical protein